MHSDEQFQVHSYVSSSASLKELERISGEWKEKEFWSFKEIMHSMESRKILVLYAEEIGFPRWAGVSFVDLGITSCDLLYVYVLERYRGSGIGRLMLGYIEKTKPKSISEMLLEVRETNEVAIALYEKMGMIRIAKRESYYSDGEDALIYKMKFDKC